MAVSRIKLPSRLGHLLGAATLLALTLGAIYTIIWSFAHTLAKNSDAIQASEFAAWLSPSDPLARFRFGFDLEKTFEPGSIARGLGEYEAAVAASPHNFVFWLALGQARERDGDRLAAELAYRRALQLAPSYARSRWALGNNLVRQGRLAEGLDMIRGAVDQDPAFAAPAVNAAMLAFDGDIQQVHAALAANTVAAAEMVRFLINTGRFDEALEIWDRSGIDNGTGQIRETVLAIRGKLIDAKRFRNAVRITRSLEADETKRPAIGSIVNGGFEAGVGTQNVDYFDWQIGRSYPLFGLADSQPKEGKYSLLLRFTAPARLEFETVSRTVAVEPGASYQLAIAVRSELTTRAEFRWEITSGSDGKRLAISDPIPNRSGWSEFKLPFTVPTDVDGVTIKLVREKCDSAACTIAGNLWFDDFRLSRS